MLPEKFTYPFCYVPHPLIREAAAALIARIDASPELRELFAEGKMMGALLVEDASGATDVLYAFSGVAGGRAVVDGFVPPIFDLTVPGGYYRAAEARITEINRRRAIVRGEAAALEEERKNLSVALQDWIFEHYMVSNALG